MKHALAFSVINLFTAVAGWVCVWLNDTTGAATQLLLTPYVTTLFYVGPQWRKMAEELKENANGERQDLPIILGIVAVSTIPQSIYWLI